MWGDAYSFYAEPRFTKDLKIFLDRSAENAEKVIQVLSDFGFTGLGLTKEDFIKAGDVVQLGVAPVRIDLVTSITGVEFSEAWINRSAGHFGDVPVHIISKADLIRNKAAVGRMQDLSDIDKLRKI